MHPLISSIFYQKPIKPRNPFKPLDHIHHKTVLYMSAIYTYNKADHTPNFKVVVFRTNKAEWLLPSPLAISILNIKSIIIILQLDWIKLDHAHRVQYSINKWLKTRYSQLVCRSLRHVHPQTPKLLDSIACHHGPPLISSLDTTHNFLSSCNLLAPITHIFRMKSYLWLAGLGISCL